MIRLILIALLLPATTTAAASPYGYWLTEKKGLIVQVYDCEGELCGRTVWMKRMTHKDGTPRLDAKNPEPALRDRHWCGIEVITGVRPDGENKWEKGEIYDPKTGETFSINMELKGERMKVRGYLGVPLLGKSETWTRANIDDVELCAS